MNQREPSNLRQPPGPRYLVPLGVSGEFRRDPLGFAMRLHERFGDVATIRMGSRRAFYLFHPDDIAHVLHDNHRNYVKGPSTAKVKVFFGDGLFSSEGATWRSQRRLLQAAFDRQSLQDYVEPMASCAAAMLDAWEAKAADDVPIDLVAEMKRFTLTAVARTLFGSDLGEAVPELAHVFAQVLEHLNHRVTSLLPIPNPIPTPRNLRFRRANRSLEDLVAGLVERRRRSPVPQQDMLATLLGARDPETGRPLTERNLRDQILTFMMAGHETTAATLAWALYSVASYPEVERRLHEEVSDVLAGSRPTAQDLKKLTFTHRVVQETLRIYPPAPFVSRQPIEPDTIRGYHVPAGSSVTACGYVAHRHREYWDDPERFDPDRFTIERSASRPRHAYLPFGGGPQICIGNDFALMEEQLVLAMTAQRYRLVPDPARRIGDGVRAVRARDGLWVSLEPRGKTEKIAAGAP